MKVRIAIILPILLVALSFIHDGRGQGAGMMTAEQMARVRENMGRHRRIGPSQGDDSEGGRGGAGMMTAGDVARLRETMGPDAADDFLSDRRRVKRRRRIRPSFPEGEGDDSEGGGGGLTVSNQGPSSRGGGPPSLLSAADVARISSRLGADTTSRLIGPDGRPPISPGSSGRGGTPSGGTNRHVANGQIDPGGYDPGYDPFDQEDYPTVEWTEWGHCNATCGVGYQARTRQHLEGTAEWKRCVAMDCDEEVNFYAQETGECPDANSLAVLFGVLMGILATLGAIGTYFLITKLMGKNKEVEDPVKKRGPLPPTPKGSIMKVSKSSATKVGVKGVKSVKIKTNRKSKYGSGTDTYDEAGGNSSDDSNPYLDPTEINPPGSAYLIDQLGEPPAPPSKHYLDDENTLYEAPNQPQEPDYIEFEG